MRHIVLEVRKFDYTDKVTKEVKHANVVMLFSDKGVAVKPIFMTDNYYTKYNFDKFVFDKSDVDNLFKNYKACDVSFDSEGRIVELSEVKED